MWTLARSLLAGLALAAACCAPLRASEPTTFALHAYGVTRSSVIIDTDQDVLVPSLQSERLTHDNLREILPYSGTDEAKATEAELLSHPELSLGHTKLYFYLAVNQAFERILRSLKFGIALMPAELQSQQESVQELGGVDVAALRARFVDTRSLVRATPVDGRVLRLTIFFDEKRFNAAAAAIGLHGSKAFWDPRASHIGILFDGNIFQWYQQRGGRDQLPPWLSALHVHDYVWRQSIDRVAHEIVHFLQVGNRGFLGDRPFLAEAAALIVQGNLAVRDEIVRVQQSAGGRKADQPEVREKCRELARYAPPFYSNTLLQYQRGIEAAAAGNFALARVLQLSEREFYAQPTEALLTQYDVALAFGYFATEQWPVPRFNAALLPLIEGRNPGPAELKKLEGEFHAWAVAQAAELHQKDAMDLFGKLMEAADFCSTRGEYLDAFEITQEMQWVMPRTPMALMYAGDIFYNLQVPFFAFDYYTLASHYEPPKQISLVLDSRVADAFELVGDIGSAVDWWSRILPISPDDIPGAYGVTFYRSALQAEFYANALAAGYGHHPVAQQVMSRYVAELQGQACISAADKKHLLEDDANAQDEQAQKRRKKILAERYRLVSATMRSETYQHDIADVAKAQEARCAAIL